ncbi:hypothetical protein ACFYW8_22145 [Streptomyces sp. NPDC002742]|uniref:hypothetical protein n=1 Tax=Streptomyces sp. NPDC002742 TaxID=3364663 RepID=UPI00367D6D34
MHHRAPPVAAAAGHRQVEPGADGGVVGTGRALPVDGPEGVAHPRDRPVAVNLHAVAEQLPRLVGLGGDAVVDDTWPSTRV